MWQENRKIFKNGGKKRENRMKNRGKGRKIERRVDEKK